MADEVAVMYGGSIVEHANVRELFQRPYHPYTWGIFQALPRMDDADRILQPLHGSPPTLLNLPDQCPFVPRCPKAGSRCREETMPQLGPVAAGHLVACYNMVDHRPDDGDSYLTGTCVNSNCKATSSSMRPCFTAKSASSRAS